MDNLIACRPESYGRYSDRAFESLAKLGVRWVEIAAPLRADAGAAAARLSQQGLQASSVTFHDSWAHPDFLSRVAEVVDAASALRARIIFTSQKVGDGSRSEAYARLRAAGDIAAKGSATIVLETHPDLCQNGGLALETMEAIGHPHIGVNFDPANIHYYNENVNAIAELKKIISWVKAVHLKDTNGGFHAHHFPAIGDGVVDWKSLFALLRERGMTGPFTMEMEGIAGEDLTFEETEERIRRSLDFLKSSGLMAQSAA